MRERGNSIASGRNRLELWLGIRELDYLFIPTQLQVGSGLHEFFILSGEQHATKYS